ncbi:MAG: hypothetical protein AB8I08_14495 [Sandaracinaceae bacterium]
MRWSRPLLVLIAVLAMGCGRDTRVRDGGAPDDAGVASDAASVDGGQPDARPDAGDSGVLDAGSVGDAGSSDAGPTDAGASDGGGGDAGLRDSGPSDSGTSDSGPPSGGCISGAVGTHVARFRWNGSGSGSTAYVSYEANTLPDTSRWRASAYSTSPTYRPVFSDPFLAEGGLDMSGTVFMDIELSTAGLPPISRATVALYGRSFNTTTSGSFEWQTFDGVGATPSGSVSNAAPYRWYPGDATAALPAGNDGILLRIRPAGPSNSLVVSRVEVCFDTR